MEDFSIETGSLHNLGEADGSAPHPQGCSAKTQCLPRTRAERGYLCRLDVALITAAWFLIRSEFRKNALMLGFTHWAGRTSLDSSM